MDEYRTVIKTGMAKGHTFEARRKKDILSLPKAKTKIVCILPKRFREQYGRYLLYLMIKQP